MSKKNDRVLVWVPKSFLGMLDVEKAERGYRNRTKFLKDIQPELRLSLKKGRRKSIFEFEPKY